MHDGSLEVSKIWRNKSVKANIRTLHLYEIESFRVKHLRKHEGNDLLMDKCSSNPCFDLNAATI